MKFIIVQILLNVIILGLIDGKYLKAYKRISYVFYPVLLTFLLMFIDNEVVINKGTAALSTLFTNVLYKVKTDPVAPLATFTDCIKNTSPIFDTVSTNRREYNFRLRDESPAKDFGISTTPRVTIDLDGNLRPIGTKPDLGCYEKQ